MFSKIYKDIKDFKYKEFFAKRKKLYTKLNIDMRDMVILIGLIIMCSGLWMLRPWLGLTVFGAFLLYQALMSESGK